MKRRFLFFLFCLTAQLSFSQVQKLFSFKTDAYGGPSASIYYNGKLYFSAFDPAIGRELWSTDGTVGGTLPVKDIHPGSAGAFAGDFISTAIVHNGILYFRANNGINGFELWRSDGTDGGTWMLKDIVPGPGDSYTAALTSTGSLLFFTNNSGTQLWRSDGSDAGTFSIQSFQVASNLAAFNGQLFFSADQNNSGQELWKSNGTSNGTVLLKDLNGVFGASLPCNFYASGQSLFFTANTASGWELWKTNGSNAGTVQVADINPGAGNGVMDVYMEAPMTILGDTVFFRANDGNGYQLWKSDGSAGGTVKLSALANGVYSYVPFPLAGNRVLAANYSMSHYWAYDAGSGTATLSDYPYFNFFNNSDRRFYFMGSRMFFAGKDSLYGQELWQSDGSSAGTGRLQESHLVNNWYPSQGQGFHTLFGHLGSVLLFTQARNPLDTDMPLFAYDTAQLHSCYAPSVVVPVPVNAVAASLVWNRVEGAAQYQLLYRVAGNNTWDTLLTTQSFAALQNLADSSDYQFLLRASCSSGWSDWSDTLFYNTGFVSNATGISLLAEREVDSSSVNLYWLKTAVISQVQFRYRLYGSTTWQTISSQNGVRHISGLQPHSFYEYQYRENIGGSWTLWSSFSLYFNTGGTLVSGLGQAAEEARIRLFPNPARTQLFLEGPLSEYHEYRLMDQQGRMLFSGRPAAKTIDVSVLKPGLYLLRLAGREEFIVLPFIKN
ncbi:MAG: T9SS type A sorting domain-containing protein [Bacteroidia bacterium]|nr:T9SS type A sorting domain-containing protein [Bacteroidia bacterium]